MSRDLFKFFAGRFIPAIVNVAVIVLLNMILNLIFVPKFRLIASSLILFFTTILYAVFIVLLFFIYGRRISKE